MRAPVGASESGRSRRSSLVRLGIAAIAAGLVLAAGPPASRGVGALIQQGTKLTATGAVGNAAFGNAVAVSADGNTALIAGYGDGATSSGAVWAFTRSGGVWSQQ